MCFIRSLIVACATAGLLGSVVGSAGAADSATLQGTVVGQDGETVAHAAVFVYSAQLKKGFAVVCPTCWVDCGKHTLTDEAGRFVLTGLSSDLKFRLLVAKDGYATAQRGNVDPAAGPVEPIKLKLRPIPSDPRMILRGRILDTDGRSIAGALIEPLGGLIEPASGSYPGKFDPLAVSNTTGEFDMSSKEAYDRVLLKVSPRGLAPVIAVASTGEKRSSFRVSPGATVIGQLLQNGKVPVANVEVIMVNARDAEFVANFGDMRVATDQNGKFAFTNVPAGFVWRLSTGETLVSANLAAPPRWCETHSDGEVVNVGKVILVRGLTLKGRVVGGDAEATNISIIGDTLTANRIAPLGIAGEFEFRGLLPGTYQLSVGNPNRDSVDQSTLDVRLEHDRTDLIFRAVPSVQRAE